MAVDCFEGWSILGSSSTGDSTIGTGSVQFSVGSYTFPCNYTSELWLDDVYQQLPSPQDHMYQQKYSSWEYVYNFSISDSINARIIFPSNFLGKVINGVVSCTFTLNNSDESGHARFYKESYVPLEFPITTTYSTTDVIDNTGRWSLNCDYSAPGVIASLSASSTNNYYTLNIGFDNYYVPQATAGNTTVGILDIPMDFAYYGQFAYGGSVTAPYPEGLPPALISCILLDVRPYSNPSTSWRCNITGARFLLDNDYYTILNAIANQTFLQNGASDLAYLKTLLNTWLDASSSTLVPINFGDFAIAVYDYLEAIQDSMNGTESFIQDIGDGFAQLIALQEDANDLLQSIIDHLEDMGLEPLQEEYLNDLNQNTLDDIHYEHRYYGSLIDSISGSLRSSILAAPDLSELQSPAHFYLGCLESLYTSIGSFAIVVSVVLLGGVLLRIIGRIH